MPINYMYSKIFHLFLLFSFVAILSCNDGAIIHRKHVKENEEVGSFVENQQVPKLDVQKLDSGINVKWTWVDYYGLIYNIDFTIPRSDIDKGEYNRLYEIRPLPLSPNEIDYGSLIRTGGIKFMDELSQKLKALAINNNLDFRRLADVTVCMIQNIPYTLIHQMSHTSILNLAKEQHIEFLISYHNDPANNPYHRDWYGGCRDSVEPAGVFTPAEFISSMQGDCDTRSLFLYTLMKKMGYDVAIVNGPGHSMLGCNLEPENPSALYINDNENRYYFWETTVFYNQNGLTGPRLGDILDPKFNVNQWKIMLK